MRKENVMSARALFLAGFGAVCLTANPAHADAIDGTWCGPDGGTLSIDGPRIVTPGHARLTGEYTRAMPFAMKRRLASPMSARS
jgi:hypothetical protein